MNPGRPCGLASLMAAVLCVTLQGSACGPAPASDDSGIPPACPPEVTWSAWGQGFFTTWCQPCHSHSTEDRNSAPAGLDFDTESQIRSQLDAIRRSVLETESMPVGGGLSEDEQILLARYLDGLERCGEVAP